MKKILSAILAAAMLLAFSACGNGGGTTTTANNATNATTTSPDATTTTTPETSDDDTKLDPPSSVDDSKLLSENYEPEKEFKNPVTSNIDTGDPFIMRYNGTYYLYYTSRGVECWTSSNLVKWKSVGRVADIDGIPYAPEVYYYNGYFYMYTSPDGGGHYVLRSDSPTGPFEPISDNLGKSIDGSVFIDDDGKWYFYRADGEGIMVHEMTSPSDIRSAYKTAVPSMSGWTEGPSVVKYNGVYFMTYCGNHYLSPGYRINYATSTSNPKKFTEATSNPLLVDTTTAAKGIGHNSIVIGPDLDSYYLVYHSMPDTDSARRETHIDRIYFNGTEMSVMAPTMKPQETLSMPQVYSYFKSTNLSSWKLNDLAALGDDCLVLSSGGTILTNDTFADKYTAELNVLSISGGKAGALFGYTDENNYGAALFDPDAQELVVRFVVGGKTTEQRFPLTRSFDEDMLFNCLQKLTVVRDGKNYTFSVNNIQLGTAESELSGGSFGAISEGGEAKIGFAAINPYANQSSTKDFYKPTNTEFYALTCVEDDLTFDEKYGAKAIVAKADSYFNYRVNVTAKGTYDFAIKYYSDSDARVDLYQNKNYLGSVILPASGGNIATAILNGVELKTCYGIITVRVSSGQANILSYETDASKEVYLNVGDKNGYKALKVLYKDSDSWTIDKDKITHKSVETAGKLLYGSYDWNNYTIESTIKFTSVKMNGGILFRATNPSLGGANDSASGGYVFYQGYYLVIARNSLRLVKINYGATDIASAECKISPKTEYNFKITVDGARILVYVNDELVIDCTDPEPHLQGAFGFSGSNTGFEVSNIKVTPVD